MNEFRLAIFHYHFLPGGVTTVVKLAVKSILENSSLCKEIAIISGRKDNTCNLTGELQTLFPGIVISSEIINEIGYFNENESFDSRKASVIEKTLEKYRGFIYWVHNYHIGKNPYFTKILTNFALRERDQKFIFHVHDFPENGRFRNYSYLKKIITDPYPQSENIKYSVINSRDYNYLIKSGIDRENVFLIPNPVLPPALKDRNKDPAKRKVLLKNLEKRAAGLYNFDSSKPIALYPVRAIRRKNILEAALLGSITETGFNLVVTLPGLSSQEIRYSDYVSGLYEKGIIRGIWGTGIRNSPVETDLFVLVDICDFVVSSSVMEGFGYLFADALSWGKPVISRYMEIIEDFRPVLSDTSSYFYNNIFVPSSPFIKENIRKEYKLYIDRLDLPETIKTALEKNISEIVSGDCIDFSYLTCEMQGEILTRTAEDKGYRSETAGLNSFLTGMTEKIIFSGDKTEPVDISSSYGSEKFTANFLNLTNSFENKREITIKNSNISERLFSIFTTPESLRLIIEKS